MSPDYFSKSARDCLKSIPTIAIDFLNASPEFTPKVRFTTVVYGLHAVGTAYRMNSVPLPFRVLHASNYPTDEDVLSDLLAGFMDD